MYVLITVWNLATLRQTILRIFVALLTSYIKTSVMPTYWVSWVSPNKTQRAVCVAKNSQSEAGIDWLRSPRHVPVYWESVFEEWQLQSSFRTCRNLRPKTRNQHIWATENVWFGSWENMLRPQWVCRLSAHWSVNWLASIFFLHQKSHYGYVVHSVRPLDNLRLYCCFANVIGLVLYTEHDISIKTGRYSGLFAESVVKQR